MKIKFVCDCLIYSHVNFHDNRTMRTVIGRKKSHVRKEVFEWLDVDC